MSRDARARGKPIRLASPAVPLLKSGLSRSTAAGWRPRFGVGQEPRAVPRRADGAGLLHRPVRRAAIQLRVLADRLERAPLLPCLLPLRARDHRQEEPAKRLKAPVPRVGLQPRLRSGGSALARLRLGMIWLHRAVRSAARLHSPG